MNNEEEKKDLSLTDKEPIEHSVDKSQKEEYEAVTESEPEEIHYIRQNGKFKLAVEDEIKKIPDYVTVHRVKKGAHRAGVLAKVMFGVIIVCVSVGLALAIIFGGQDILGMGKLDSEILVEIQQNSGVAQVAQVLEEQGVINSSLLFRAYFKFSKSEPDFQYGTYSLNSNMSYSVILNELKKYSSTKEEVQIMFKEGTTIYQMADLLQTNKVCTAAEFISAVDSTDFGYAFEDKIENNKLRFHKLEGYLFPDTYKFFVGDSPVNVAKKIVTNFDKRLNELLLTGIPASGFTQEQVVTIASIVQLEAGKPEEMKKVASVYLNRLKNPGEYARLQADPTRGYANELKLQMGVINQEVLDAYNTYEGQGLPPGPICNPGLDAFRAVLEPEQTDYFYFCTDSKTGKFYYAQTIEEHNKNVKKAGLRQSS